MTSYGSISGAGVQKSETGCCCCNCCVAVPQDRYYAVESFGEYQRILNPGFSCVGFDCCGCCFTFRSISRRVEQNDCTIETKTKDNVFVKVKCAIQQSVIPDRAQDAIYRLDNVGAQVDSYVADVVRTHVPQMTLDEAFEHKDTIAEAVKKEIGKQMEHYGFEIHKALVTEIRPDQQVMDSMNEINKQRRLRDAALMSAEADKLRVVKAAEAAAEAACLQGQGIARQRAAIVEGLRESINHEDGGEKLSNARVSELLLICQYFETLKEIGAHSKTNSIFIPQSPAASIASISSQIRDGVLQGAAAKEA